MYLPRAMVYYQTGKRKELLATFEPDEMFVSPSIYFQEIDPDIDWAAMGALVEGMFKDYEKCEDAADVRRWAKRFCNEIKVELV